jgi:hypothetical protein
VYGIEMGVKEITLSVNGDAVEEVVMLAFLEGKALSGFVEKCLELLLFAKSVMDLFKRLGLGSLELALDVKSALTWWV